MATRALRCVGQSCHMSVDMSMPRRESVVFFYSASAVEDLFAVVRCGFHIEWPSNDA